MGDFNDLGGVSILGFISPFNTGDTYPVIDPLYGIDGFRNVNTISELNAIPNARRRAGMIVGVSGGTEYYKLNSSPWSGNLFDWTLIYLTNSPITGFTYNGNDNTFTLTDGYGVSLNAYLNSISGLTSTGVISSNTLSATTYLNLPLDIFVTGGTYNNTTGEATFVNNTGGTFNVYGFFTGQTDTVLSAFTYNNANTLTISDTSGNAFSSTVNTMTGLTVTGAISAATISGGTFFGDGSNLSGISTQDLYITGMTFNPSNYNLSIARNDSAIFTQNLAILSSDINITGGTYNSNTGVATFTNNTGGTFNVTGFTTGSTDTFVTGTTLSSNQATLRRNDGVVVMTISGGTDVTLNNPAVNQIVLDVNSLKYFISDSVPTGFTIDNGFRWFNTEDGNEYVFIDDGNSSQWVQPAGIAGPRGLGNTILTNSVTQSAETLNIDYNYYGVNYSGNVDLTLPDPSGFDGYNINIKDESGNAGIYRIRLIPSVGLIDGALYVDMNLNYMSLHIVARNNNWWII